VNVMPCMREWYERNVVRPEQRRTERIRERAEEIMRLWPGLSLEEAEDDARTEFELAKSKTGGTP
jgi:hypothetical protein